MKTQRTYRLLIFEILIRRTRNRVLLLFILLLGVTAVDALASVWGEKGFWIWVATGLAFVLLLYELFYGRRGRVRLSPDKFAVTAAFWWWPVSYKLVKRVHAAQFSRFYKQKLLSDNELTLLEPIYQKRGVVVELAKMPAWWRFRHLFFPRYMFTPDGKGLFLVVKDWQELGKSLSRTVGKGGQAVLSPAQSVFTEGFALGKVTEKKVAGGGGKMPAFSLPNPSDIPITNEIRTQPLILVAENSKPLRTQLNSLLTQHYNVILAKDGAEGLRLALDNRPDLILSDLAMPNMDGRQLLWAIRNNPILKNTPFIFLSASGNVEDRIATLEAGADDYLIKPCNNTELLVRVRNLLHRRTQELELQRLNKQLEVQVRNQLAELVVSGDVQHFLPQAVVENIKQGRILPTDVFERRTITILFIDIVGFSAITDRLDPDKLALLLNDYLREMTALANLYGGTVDKFIGDGLMLLFGAPEQMPPKEQAWSAIQAAFAMLHQNKELSDRWHTDLSLELKVRVGINTGESTIGVFGSDLLKSYTAVGSAVNISSRLEGECMPGGILISRTTYDLIKTQVKAEPRGRIKLKGVLDPVEAWDVVSLTK